MHRFWVWVLVERERETERDVGCYAFAVRRKKCDILQPTIARNELPPSLVVVVVVVVVVVDMKVGAVSDPGYCCHPD